MKKQHWRKPDDIELSDVRTPEDKVRYSEMMYHRYNDIGHDEPPSVLLDFQRFPPETEDWMSAEYWIAHAKAERERLKSLRGK